MDHKATEAIEQVHMELNRQDMKWGAERKMHFLEWWAILSEEFGEVAKEVVEGNWSRGQEALAAKTKMYKELSQVAAVAIQFMEDLDRELYGTHLRRDIPHNPVVETVPVSMIHKLIGYVENGSDSIAKIFQDDATKEYCVTVYAPGKDDKPFVSANAGTLKGVIEKASAFMNKFESEGDEEN